MNHHQLRDIAFEEDANSIHDGNIILLNDDDDDDDIYSSSDDGTKNGSVAARRSTNLRQALRDDKSADPLQDTPDDKKSSSTPPKLHAKYHNPWKNSRTNDSFHSIDSHSIHLSAASITSEDGHRQNKDENGDERVVLNVSGSNIDRILFCFAPSTFVLDSDQYAMVSFKIHPAFCNDITCHVENDGWRAKISFKIPKNFMNPKNILGADVDESHVIFQSFQDEIFRLQGKYQNRPKIDLYLNLPFQSEPKTSDEIFGQGTGQTANLIPIKKNPTSEDFTGNAVFFFKKRGNAFKVHTHGSSYIYDGRDMNENLEDRAVRNTCSDNDDTTMPLTDLSGKKRRK